MQLVALLVLAAFATAHSAAKSPHNVVKSPNLAAEGGGNGHDYPRTVIRETTMYYGNGNGKAASPTSQNGFKAIPTAISTPPANLITSLSQLKPLFDYGVHHPLKFILNYVFPSTFRFLLRLALLLYSYLLVPLLHLIVLPFSLLLRPFIALYESTVARFLLAGLVVGALGGAATAYGSQFGVNILVKKTDKLAKEIKEIGARFERIPIREKGKERGRMNGTTYWNPYGSGFAGLEDEEEVEEEVIDRAEEEMRPVKITSYLNRGANIVGGAFASARQGGTVPAKRRMAGRR